MDPKVVLVEGLLWVNKDLNLANLRMEISKINSFLLSSKENLLNLSMEIIYLSHQSQIHLLIEFLSFNQ